MSWLRRLPPFETAVVVLAVIVLSALSVLQHSGVQTVSIGDTFSSYDSIPGGYRAWFELLQREGAPVDRFERRLTSLSNDVAVLVWAEPGSATGPEIDALEAWVKAGGTLLYLGHDDVAATNGALGLPHTKGSPLGVHGATFASELRVRGIASLDWSSTTPRFSAKKGARVLARDAHGILALRYRYGRGSITVVGDEALFTNRDLARHDDARFAYVLATATSGARRPGAVAFDEAAHGYLVADHWWEIVPKPFLISVIVAVLALLVAFAGGAVRLGPPLEPPKSRDATSAEFIASVAALLQRGGGGRQALEDAAHSTRRTLGSALGLGDTGDGNILKRLTKPQQRADFSDLIELANRSAPGDAEVLHGVALAQRLRKEYTSDVHRRR